MVKQVITVVLVVGRVVSVRVIPEVGLIAEIGLVLVMVAVVVVLVFDSSTEMINLEKSYWHLLGKYIY